MMMVMVVESNDDLRSLNLKKDKIKNPSSLGQKVVNNNQTRSVVNITDSVNKSVADTTKNTLTNQRHNRANRSD